MRRVLDYLRGASRLVIAFWLSWVVFWVLVLATSSDLWEFALLAGVIALMGGGFYWGSRRRRELGPDEGPMPKWLPWVFLAGVPLFVYGIFTNPEPEEKAIDAVATVAMLLGFVMTLRGETGGPTA